MTTILLVAILVTQGILFVGLWYGTNLRDRLWQIPVVGWMVRQAKSF